MPLIPAKCPNCGASIEVEGHEGASICKYCKTALINEAAINNYYNYTKNVVNVEKVDELIYRDEHSIDNKLENVETYISIHRDYSKARELLSELENIAPGRYEVWWDILRVNTRDFEDADCSEREFAKLEGVSRRVFALVSPEERELVSPKWEDYCARHTTYIDRKRAEKKGFDDEKDRLNQEIEKREQRIKEINSSTRDISNEIQNNANWRENYGSKKRRPVNVGLTLAIIWLIICLIVFASALNVGAPGVGVIWLVIGVGILALAGYAFSYSCSKKNNLINTRKSLEAERLNLQNELSELNATRINTMEATEKISKILG